MSDGVWRGVFFASAVFNLIVGMGLAYDTSAMMASMGVEVVRYHALWSPLIGWFVILFGMLYYAVGRDLSNRAIVFIGMVGKLGVVAIVVLAWSRGFAPFVMVGLAMIDVVFAILFGMFLLTRRSAT